MGTVMWIWVICSMIFTWMSTMTDGVYGFARGVGVSLVVFPFMLVVGLVVSV